jgi:hypothetical protein
MHSFKLDRSLGVGQLCFLLITKNACHVNAPSTQSYQLDWSFDMGDFFLLLVRACACVGVPKTCAVVLWQRISWGWLGNLPSWKGDLEKWNYVRVEWW